MSTGSEIRPAPTALWASLATTQQAILRAAAQAARDEGGAAYLVGGPVRDLLRGDTRLHDIDIVTTVDARRVAERFATIADAEVVKTTAFGTASVRVHTATPDTLTLDLATARTEVYPRPGALPSVTFSRRIEDDLARRDVTINAMALPIDAEGFGALLDPFGGWADLQAGTIRILHDASFHDDPTRLYRAVRYAARFTFAIAPDTTARIAEAVQGDALATISPDRKRHELELGLRERDAVACFAAFDASHVLRATSPVLLWDTWIARRLARLRESNQTAWAGLDRTERLRPTLTPVWALFVCRQGDPAVDRLVIDLGIPSLRAPIRALVRVWAERTRIASSTRLSDLAPLLSKSNPPDVLAMLDGAPGEAQAKAFFARGEQIAQQDRQWGHSFGNDLKDRGLRPGPAFREILGALMKARLDGEVTSLEEALHFVHNYVETHHMVT